MEAKQTKKAKKIKKDREPEDELSEDSKSEELNLEEKDDSEGESKSKEKKSKKSTKKSKPKSNLKKRRAKSPIRSRSKSPNRTKKDNNKGSQIQSTMESFIKIEQKASKTYPTLPLNAELKIIHWNINGLRPLLKRQELEALIKNEDPDFICFNETKIDPSLVEKNHYNILFQDKYKSVWYCPTEKKGYSGTAILTKYEPISIKYGIGILKHDQEGRVITLEYDKFYLVSCYTPNAGEGLKRLDYRTKEWDTDFFAYINSLKDRKNVILCGDLNVAKEDIDIYEPKGHEKSPGFTKEEKESFKKFLEMGYVDTFRDLHGEEKKFSYFSKRGGGMKEANKGWRLDYFVVNNEHDNLEIIESDMIDKNKYESSDHIPLVFTFKVK